MTDRIGWPSILRAVAVGCLLILWGRTSSGDEGPPPSATQQPAAASAVVEPSAAAEDDNAPAPPDNPAPPDETVPPSEASTSEASTSEAATSEAAAGETASEATANRALPESFDRLRPIYFFQGQASGLVPDSFRPLAISQLDGQLRAQRGLSVSAFEKPQLLRAVYVARLIDASLVSTQSTWEIAYSGSAPTRMPLGKIGLALQSAVTFGGSSVPTPADAPPVVTDPEGSVSVAVAGDTKLALAWTAAGRESQREILFDIAIPKAGQARWLIAVPQGHQVQALDGVGRALPSPPPEAGVRDLGRGTSWFAIEAGGLSRVRLRILKVAPDGPEEAAVIRQASTQYDLGPALIRFTSRLILDARPDGSLPPLQVDGGRITSVSLDGSSANWTETSIGSGRILRINSNRAEVASGGAINVTIDGEAAWGSRPGPQKLPWLQLRDCVPILIGNEMQVKVLIDSRLRIPRLELPSNWRYTSPLEADERRTTYLLGGPWGSDAPAVRAVPDPGQVFADSLLRLSASESRLRAVADISIPLAALGPQPIRLRVEPSWTPEVVLLPQSGRVVDLPQEVAARRNLTVWPTADELKNGNLLIRVVGSQPLPSEGDFARYPSTSFLSISNCRNRFAAVVTPPPGFRWTADASLRTHRITADQLSPTQRELLGELPPDALLLDISQSKVAALGSRRPAAAFRASSLLRLTLENNRLVETHFVKCDSASGGLNQIRIEFAPGNRPDIQWAVMDQANSTRRLIRARRITAVPEAASPAALGSSELAEELPSVHSETAEPRELWELELEQADARSVMLVGRRELPMPPSPDPLSPAPAQAPATVRIDLPSVYGASTRLAQVLVEPSLDVHRYGAGVLRVPQLVGSDRLLIGTPSAGGTALRYDSTAATWVELRAVEAAAAVPVLWQESVEIVASGRGGDWITATYSADAESALVIDHEPGMRLVAVTDQDEARLDYDTSPSRLSVKALPSSRQVVVQWSRPAGSTELWQQWMPPTISPTGVLLRRDWQVTAAADTLIPVAWTEGLNWRLDPTAPQALWLVDRSIGLSLIAVVGGLLFGLAWWVSLASPLAAGIGFAIAGLLLSGLPLGWGYWIAGVCVPIAAGALVGTTLSARSQEERTLRTESSIANSTGARTGRGGGSVAGADISRTVAGAQERSSRSLLGRIGGWLLIGSSLSLSVSMNAVAQEQAAEAPPPRPTVLIPTKPDGTPAGDKVYISQTLFDELFQGKTSTAAAPLITSAAYRLRLDGMTESGMPAADWEARYSLVDLGERSELVLPIRPSQVRSVQWLPVGEAKPLRWSPEGEANIRIHLPPGPSADLLLRLTSDVELPQRGVRRIRFKIPAVVSASLVVDSSSAVQRFELAEALGQTIAQPEIGRLSAALGAIDAIDLTVMLRQGSRGITAIAARRYWVHASEKGCQIECEVEPGEEALRRGSDVPIVILGGSAPILTSTDWAVHASEMVSPRRQLLTLRALRDAPEPIRLLWQVDAAALGGSNEGPAALVIPDVISAGSANTPEALIALHAAEGLRLVAQPSLTAASDSVDAVDAFIASWKGYRGTAQQVIRSPSPLTRLALIEAPARPWTAAERHHLHIRPGELRLTYDATITRGERSLGPLRVALPLGSDVREVTLNGQPISAAPQRIGNRLEIALPDPAGQEKLLLRVVTHQRAPTIEPFQPPRIRVEPIHQVSGSYSLTRNHALRVEQITATELPEIATPPLDIADQLLSSWIPCWTWRLSEQAPGSAALSDRPTELPGAFRIEPQSTNLDVLQQTAVRWRQARWMMDAVIHVQRRNSAGDELPLLDDINIELPTAWSDQLQVEPAEAWSSQPAIDPAMKVVRIRPDAAARAAGVTTIRLQGLRMSEADSLLQVPRVQVLSATTRRSFFVVPQSLGGRPLTWKAIAAVADQLPEAIVSDGIGNGTAAEQTPPSAAARDGENQPLVFRALSNTATVQLEPSRSEAIVARATVADIQLFPQSRDQWLAILRWDLEPGDRDRVSINVPPGATPVACWTAGKPLPLAGRLPASPRPASTAGAEPATATSSVIEIPLAISRLAQPLVMLFRLQVDPLGSRPELPTLLDIEVEQTWLSLYQSGLGTADGPTPRLAVDDHWQAAQLRDRLLTLAQSVLTVTESSVSGATDRPQEELIAWLKPWDERLAKLKSEARRDHADHPRPSSDAPEGKEADEADELDPATAGEDAIEVQDGLPEPWETLGRQWRRYVRRVTSGEASPSAASSAAIMPATHWQVAFVAHHAGAAQRLPLLTFHHGSSPVAMAIQLLIGLVMVIGSILLAWRFKRLLAPLFSYPVFWLFAVGVGALAVAPTPVALSILLVAVMAPVLGGRASAPNTAASSRDALPRRLAERS